MTTNASKMPAKDAGHPFMSPQLLDWFAARKISMKTLLRNHIVERKVQMSNKLPESEDAIVFPSTHNGQLVGLEYRTLDKRYSQSQRFQAVWYGIDDVGGQDTIIVVEGEPHRVDSPQHSKGCMITVHMTTAEALFR